MHRIQALKHFGCSLSDIKAYLDDAGIEPAEIIHRQISVLDEQARRARHCGTVFSTAEKITRGSKPAWRTGSTYWK